MSINETVAISDQTETFEALSLPVRSTTAEGGLKAGMLKTGCLPFSFPIVNRPPFTRKKDLGRTNPFYGRLERSKPVGSYGLYTYTVLSSVTRKLAKS